MRTLAALTTCLLMTAGLTGVAAAQERTPSPPGARVYIVSPPDGALVTSPVKVIFGLSGMGVAPAGVIRENTGHHHLMIDVDGMPPMDQPLPADDNHRHFGGGQTETTVELAPGTHTLQLTLGDHIHVPHDPPVVSQRITVTVR